MQNPVPHCITRPLASLLLLAALGTSAWAQTHPLNDTGITWSGQATSGNESGSNCGGAGHPAGQDCHYGRDAAAAAGEFTKVGAGPAGFDFTKVCNSGELAGEGSCPNDPPLGADANEWACTKDNVTGLIWEVKVNNTNHLRHMNHSYTWYDSSSPDGNNGVATGGSCGWIGWCDTERYVITVNESYGASLCGAHDWRMPTVNELLSIVDYSKFGPAIDATYFPNSPSGHTWSSSPHASSNDYAWVVYADGSAGNGVRSNGNYVRLVRSAP